MINIFAYLFAMTFIIGLLYLRYIYMIYSIPKRMEEAKQLFETNEKKAVAICNSILSLDKGNPVANWLMAKFHTKYKRYILALMFLNEIINYAKYTPEVTEQEVRETVSQLYLYLGNIEKALAQFNILQGRYPVNTSLIKKMVAILLEMGNAIEARRLVEKAIESSPGDGELDYLYATILFKQNDYIKAESKLNIAIKNGCKSSEVYFLLGKIQFISAKFSEASENLTKAYEKNPEDKLECTNLLVQSYFKIHNYRAALDLAENTIENFQKDDPNTTAIRYYLGCSYEKTGNIEAALGQWKMIKAGHHYYDEAKQKADFYTYIAKQPYEREFITQPVDSFMLISEKLIDLIAYTIKDSIRAEDDMLEYVCVAKNSSSLFHYYYFVISRKTEPISLTDLKDISIRKNVNKCKYSVVIALYFREDAKQYAQRKGIQLYDLSVFEKYKLL